MEVQAIQITANLLHNPSFVPEFSSFVQLHRLWKWGALILAMLAACRSLIRRSKLIFMRFRNFRPTPHTNEETIEFDDDDDLSIASSDDEQDAGENAQTTSFRGQHSDGEDFSVRGSSLSYKTQLESSDLRQRRKRWAVRGAWTELNPGKNVVKLWDSFRLRLDFDEDLFNFDSDSVVTTWDFDHDRKANEFCDSTAISSSAMVFTAEVNGSGEGLILNGYDSRIGRRSPALYAEWSSPAEEVTGKSSGGGGGGRVYVRDGVNGMITVGDVRMVALPLETMREADGESWWDADAVILEEGFADSS